MASLDSLISDIQLLSTSQQEQFLSYLEFTPVLSLKIGQAIYKVKEFSFNKGKVPHSCSSKTLSRNGKYKEKQKYICKSCNKTFSYFTNSSTYKLKK